MARKDDVEKKGWRWAPVPADVIMGEKLSSTDVRVYAYLLWRAGKKERAWPGVPTIAKDIHMSEGSVRLAFRNLISDNWVRRERRYGQSSVTYVFEYREDCLEYDRSRSANILTDRENERLANILTHEELKSGGIVSYPVNPLNESHRTTDKEKTRASGASAPISADFLPEEFFVTGKPNGDGAGSGSGKRALTREDGGRLAKVERLEIVFAEVRGCDLPSWETDKEAKAAQKTWRTPLYLILKKCGEDIEWAERAIREVVTEMVKARLTFSKPVQILETFDSWIIDYKGNTGGLESMGYTYMGS